MELNGSGEWIPELCEELCDLAGMSAECDDKIKKF